MMDYKAVLNKKVAGVPVYIIAFIVAAGLLYMAFRMKPTPDATDTGDAGDNSTDLAGDVADVQQPVFTAPSSGGASGVPGSITTIPTQDTNELWARRVTEALLTANYPYSVVSGMVSKYLSGQSLNAEEAKLRDIAIRTYGLPPEPVDYAPDQTGNDDEGDTPVGPAVRQGDPPCNHTVAGKDDDTPVELSRLYYGVNKEDSRAAIQNANPGMTWPVEVGTIVRIPVYAPAPEVPDGPNVPPPPPPVNPPPSSNGGVDDRTKWGREAKGYLKRQGHNPDRVETAIDRYLADKDLTDNQQALVNEAVKRFGKPPKSQSVTTSNKDGLTTIVKAGSSAVVPAPLSSTSTLKVKPSVTPGFPVKLT